MFFTQLPVRGNIAGCSFEMLIEGEGPPLLFLHAGHGFDANDPLIGELARSFKVHAVSHPGFGESDLPKSVTTVTDLTYFYLDLIESLDLKNLILVGVSFGAWIATELATMGTGRIAKLVLLDAVGLKFSDRETREITDVYATTVEEIPALFFSDIEKGRAVLRNLDFRNMDEASVRRFVRNRESFLLFGWSPTLYNPKLNSRLHRINFPALVLWGKDDRVVSVDYGRQFADSLPNAAFDVVSDAGHYGYLEKPEEFARKIEAFLN